MGKADGPEPKGFCFGLMGNIIRVSKNKNFSVLSNEPFNDPSLSWKAKGLLAFLLTRPDNWQINVNHLRTCSTNGRDAIYSILKELIKVGYIQRFQKRTQQGRADGYEYIISESKFTELPFTENPLMEKPHINKDLSSVNTECSKDLFSGEAEKQKKSSEEIIKDKKITFCKTIINFVKCNPCKYPKAMYVEFCKYWIESSARGKMRFEDQKFFDIGRRLSTWFKNDSCQKQLTKFWEAETTTPPLNEQLKHLL